MKGYRSFIREQSREIDSYNKEVFGYGKAQADEQFARMFESCVNDEITEQEFETYLNKSLMLSINDELLKECCDEDGNIINEQLLFDNYEHLNEIFGINKAIKGAVTKGKELVNKGVEKAKEVGDKVASAVKNVAMIFFKAVVDKIKAGLKAMTSALLGKEKGDKAISLMASFVEKIAAGLNKFGEWLKKHKKGIYTIIIKLMASLGITSIVSAIMSQFGAGWVAAMGGKLAASAVGKKAGNVAAKAVVKESQLYEELTQVLDETEHAVQAGEKEKLGIIEVDPSKFANFKVMTPDELKEFGIETAKEAGKVKKTMMKLGTGVVKFFKVYKKLKIALIIAFGVLFILGTYFFNPLLDPVLEVAKLQHFSEIFTHDFGGVTIPLVPDPSEDALHSFDPLHIKGEALKINIPLKEPDENYLHLQEINDEQVNAVKKVADTVKIEVEDKDMAGNGIVSLANDMRGQVGTESVPLVNCDVHAVETSTIDDGHGNTLYVTGTPAGEATDASIHPGATIQGTTGTEAQTSANVQAPKSFDDVPKIKAETDDIINKINAGKLDPKTVGQLGLDVKQDGLKDLITDDGYQGGAFNELKFDNAKLQGEYDKWLQEFDRGKLSGEALNNRIRGLQVLAAKMGK